MTSILGFVAKDSGVSNATASQSVASPVVSTTSLSVTNLAVTNLTVDQNSTTSSSFPTLTVTKQLLFTGANISNEILFTDTKSGSTLELNVQPVTKTGTVVTLPDVGLSSSIVLTEGNQTISGTKIFTSAPVFPAQGFTSIVLANTSNQLVFGITSNTTTLSAPTPSSSRIYTIPDVGGNSSFVLADGSQTINANYTFTGNQTFAAPAQFPGITLTQASNQLTFEVHGVQTVINAIQPRLGVVYTLPDVGTNSTFVLADGTLQTLSADYIFSGSNTFTGSNSVTLTTSGGTASPLNYYEQASSPTSVNWMSSAFIGTVNAAFAISRIGNMVTISSQSFSTTSGGGGTAPGPITAPAGTIPSRFRPTLNGSAQAAIFMANGVNNGSDVTVLIVINADGSITLWSQFLDNNFDNNGTLMGTNPFACSWIIT